MSSQATQAPNPIAAAVSLHHAGKLAEAEALYRDILSADPNHHDALHLLGVIELQKGHAQEAVDLISQSLASYPDDFNALNHLGEAYRALRCFDEATTCLERAIDLKKDFHQAYNNLGLVQQQRGELALAAGFFRKAVDIAPNYADGYANLANAMLEQGQVEAAIPLYERSLELRPQAPIVRFNLGNAYKIRRRYAEAIATYREAIALRDDFCDAWLALGRSLQESGDSIQARQAFEKACAIAPENVEARWAVALSHLALVNEDEASALRRRQDFARGLDDLDHWFDANRSEGGYPAVGSHQPFYLAYYDESNRDLLAHYGALCGRLAAQWQHAQGIVMRKPRRRPRVRVGIASAHLRNHSVWDALLKGWCEELDRRHIELHLFSLGPHHDAETGSARSLADRFEQGARSASHWARTIAESELDLLIYPEVGMDAMSVRLASLRLAPAQATTWGHPETSGLPTVDYFLSAEDFEPENAQENYAERLVCLPHLSCCYRPPELRAEAFSPESLGIDASQPMFICPGTPFKYAPQYDWTFVAIAKRLRRCQFLLFKWEIDSVFRRLTQRLQRVFDAAGLDYSRYVVEVPWLSHGRFASLLEQADLYLDTIGFSGFNTAMRAIETGLPIVTVDGRFMRGRLASGILKRLGVRETIVESAERYVELAVDLAQDPLARGALRKRIEQGRAMLYGDATPIQALHEFVQRPPR